MAHVFIASGGKCAPIGVNTILPYSFARTRIPSFTFKISADLLMFSMGGNKASGGTRVNLLLLKIIHVDLGRIIDAENCICIDSLRPGVHMFSCYSK